MTKNISITLLCFILLGCSKEPMKIYPLTSETEIGHTINYRSEYFVISNYNKNEKETKSIISEYNLKTLQPEKISQYENYSRFFYEETSDTPRDYKKVKNDYFNNHTIGHFSEHLIYSISWIHSDKTYIIKSYHKIEENDDYTSCLRESAHSLDCIEKE